MMYSIFKVTSVIEDITKNNDTYFKIQLNDNIWSKKFTKKNETPDSEIRKLRYMKDKFIVTTLTESKYGYVMGDIMSFNLVEEFKFLLDNSNGKIFSTELPIYDFLKNLKYKVNPDSSITLKKPYNNYNIIKDKKTGTFDKSKTICYTNNINALFKELLNSANRKIFSTKLPIYNLLITQGYKTNSNSSITLKEPYSNYNIIYDKNYDSICFTTNINDISTIVKELLDEKENNTFYTMLPLFQVLISLGFNPDKHGIITMPKPFNDYKLVEHSGISLCYHNKLEGKILDFNNIDKILNYFIIKDDSSLNTVIKYYNSGTSIKYTKERYSDRNNNRKSSSGTAQELGTLLSESQHNFIAESLNS